MNSPGPSVTLYQSSPEPSSASEPRTHLKFSCYHCLEPVTAVVAPSESVPDICPICARKVSTTLALRGLPRFGVRELCWRIVQEAQGRANCEDSLVRSYKHLQPSDYDEAKQAFWDLYDVAQSLELKLRHAQLPYDPDGAFERHRAAEAQVQAWLDEIPKSGWLKELLAASEPWRRATLTLALQQPSPAQIVALQLEHLQAQVWGWWFGNRAKQAMLEELRRRAELYRQIEEEQP